MWIWRRLLDVDECKEDKTGRRLCGRALDTPVCLRLSRALVVSLLGLISG